MRVCRGFSPSRAMLALVTITPLALCGACGSVIGYGSGSVLPHNSPPRQLPAESALRVKPGTPVVLATKDSMEVRGVYIGRALQEGPAYATRYETWRSRTQGAPALGAEVEV